MQNRHLERLAVIGILALHSCLLVYSAYVHSPTLDEPAHLAAGISHWELGRFELYRGNPPLVRMLAAIPMLFLGVETDWSAYQLAPGTRAEFIVGRDFIAANGENSLVLFAIARWMCIPFSWIGGLVCFRWAKDLYGFLPGLAALVLWCVSPNILAHAALITPDVPATAIGCFACYLFWRWLKKPTWDLTVVTGIVLGVAELCKATLVVLYPLWPLLWIAYRWPMRVEMRVRDWVRESSMLVVRILLAILVLNTGYGWQGSFKPLGKFEFVSQMFGGNFEGASGNRFSDSAFASLPVPFPEQYVLGIDVQRQVFERRGKSSYLRGKWQDGGWWYYYLYAMGVKVPIGTLGLFLVASCIGISRLGWNVARSQHKRSSDGSAGWRRELMLLTPPIVILLFVSSQTGYSEHLRYVLPIFPFFFVWISALFKSAGHHNPGQSQWGTCSIRRRMATVLLVWTTCSSLWAFPHSLSYFNEFAGGPQNGGQHLLGSNLDWGQDLRYLKQWMDAHPEARPMRVQLVGILKPEDLGLDAKSIGDSDPPRDETVKEVPSGWYAISINELQRRPVDLDQTMNGRTIMAVRKREPIAKIANTILIFRHTETRSIRD